MRKEIIFVIIAGIAVGIIVAFGAWRASSVLQTKNVASPPTSQETVKSEGKGLRITLASPEDNDVITENPVLVSGIAKANVWVAISAEEEDHVLKTDSSGVFEQEVELVGGVNQLIIYAFDGDASSIQKNLTVVYSTEFGKQQ